MVIVTEMSAVFGGLSASVACTTELNDPLVVGVPVTAPVAVLSVSPGANLPETTFQRNGAFPPLDWKCDE